MADEAILRIILDESSNRAAPAPFAPTQQSAHQLSASPAPSQTTAPAPPRTAPIPVDVVRPPPPAPPLAAAPPPPASTAATTAPPTQAQRDFIRDLIDPQGQNKHVLLEGQSGSGKSLAAKHIAFERMKMGHDVHVVDTHNPESWGGAKQVFQGQSAGPEAAKFMLDLLQGRKREASEAKLRGEDPNFKPLTIVLSDFARIMLDTPQLAQEFKTILTEARKFGISILADTTALTGAASGIKGIQDVRANFGQKALFSAPATPTDQRTARLGGTGGEVFPVPDLPDYKDRVDYGLVKPSEETDDNSPIGAAAAARRKYEKEKYDEEVAAEYAKLLPLKPPEPPFDPMEVARKRVEAEEHRALVDAEYAKLKPPKPPEVKSTLDAMLEAAVSLRGTMGGTFGTLVGIALDVTSKLRGMRGKAATKAEVVGAPTAAQVPVAERVEGGTPDDFVGPMPQASVAKPAAEAVVKVAESADTAAKKLEVFALVTAAVIGSVKAVVGEINSMADRYGDYNPEIAQAQAMAEVRKVTGDMRRAQESGHELAEFVRAQSEMQNKWEDVKTAVMKKLVPVVTGILDVMSALLGIAAHKDMDEKNPDPTTVLLNEFPNAARPYGMEFPNF